MDAATGLIEPTVRTARRKATADRNLNGQRLGRKGRDTRDRILSAAREVLADNDEPFTLSAVARRASLGMTSLYAYFSDLTELTLALLEPVMAQAEDSYVAPLRVRWPDDALFDRALTFVTGFHAFWQANSRVLHLRNTLSDAQDRRMMTHRVASARPVVRLLVGQMGEDTNATGSPASAMATVLYTGIERVVTVATDTVLPTLMPERFMPNVDHYLTAEAQLLEAGIAHYRSRA